MRLVSWNSDSAHCAERGSVTGLHLDIEWLVRYLYKQQGSCARVPDIAKAFAHKQGWNANLATVRSLSAQVRLVMFQSFYDCRIVKSGGDWIRLVGTPPAPEPPPERPLEEGEVGVPCLLRLS